MNAIEQEILNVLQRLDSDQQQRLLEFAQHMVDTPSAPMLSTLELIKLPLEERQRLIEHSLKLAADEDFETFEAYSEEDFDTDI